jgi:hypothetical protein
MVIGLVWVVGHAALMSYALRMHLIQRPVGRLLFITAVILASVAVSGMALLNFMLDTRSVSDLQLLVVAPYLLLFALPLMQLSATYSDPRPSTPHA